VINVVYLAHGPRRVVEAAAFSSLTFLHLAPTLTRPWRIVVYTDKPEVFSTYGVRCELASIHDLRDKTGATDYPHRLKILALRHCSMEYPGDLFYVDGDTYFRESPERLFASLSASTSILHEREYTLSEAIRPELHRVVRTSSFESPILRAASAHPDIVMWNAGVIGIAHPNTPLIESVLSAADELYSAYAGWIVEQLTWCLALEQRGEVLSAHEPVYHYWAPREQLTHRIVSFLREHRQLPRDELATAAFDFAPQPFPDWRPPWSVRARMLGRSARNSARGALRALASPRVILGRKRRAETAVDLDHAREAARR
jgi:hypothetical protein